MADPIAEQILRAWARLASPEWGVPRAARPATPGVCAAHGAMTRYDWAGRVEYRCLACQRERYRQQRGAGR